MTGLSQGRCALDGIRVLDLTRLLPGPFCTLLLADLGADVIKVEDPSGGDWLRDVPPLVDGTSALFAAVNRNKRSVAINLKSEKGVHDFLHLVESADVVVEGFRPGVIDRLGIGWETIHAKNPRTVLVSISGYGQHGPYRERAGHDLSYIALSGVLSMIRDSQGKPVIPGVQIGDIGGGALYAAVATLAALLAREKTGEGQWCDVSMVEGALSWLGPEAAARQADPDRRDPLSGEFPCYSVYPCSDGYITVAAIESKFWTLFVETMRLPEISDDAFAVGARADEVRDLLSKTFSQQSRSHWAELFADIDACVEPVLTVNEAREHEQMRSRATRFPFRLSGTPMQSRRPVPKLGEHTGDLLD